MKKKVLIGLIIVLFISIIGGICYFKKHDLNNKVIIDDSVFENSNESIIEENKSDIKEVDIEKEDDSVSDNKIDVESNKNNNNKKTTTSNKENSNKSTSNSSQEKGIETKQDSNNNIVNNDTKTNNSDESKQTKTEEPKVEEKHYIGIPDPNSFNYSFHHGKIEYKDMDTCLNDSYRVMEKNLDDIYSSWCIEVNDENSTVLGAYLMIKCYSGNCDKYKD